MVEKIIAAATRQADNVAFILNHVTLPDEWYEKLTRELAEDRAVLSAAQLPPSRVAVPEGQTPLNDKLGHRLLDVLREGQEARRDGTGSPYHGHSLEHCIHAAGWVQQDLRMALDLAHAALSGTSRDGAGVEKARDFSLNAMVRKKSGSWWEGRVVGFYGTEQTPDGVCVQLDKPMGPVQIYPASALELVHD